MLRAMARLAAGTMLAGYRIERLLGHGGMGVVYLATQVSLDRPVALKLIAPELAADPAFRERFLRESRVAASIDHPNVVPVHEAGEEDGVLYVAMRYVEGSDLGALLRATRAARAGARGADRRPDRRGARRRARPRARAPRRQAGERARRRSRTVPSTAT